MTIAHTPVIPLGTRTDFVVEVTYDDGSDKAKKLTPRVRVTAGWVDRVEVEPDAYVEAGSVSSWKVSFRNRVFKYNDTGTVFNLSVDLPSELSHTLTETDVENLTASEVASRPSLTQVHLGNNDTAELKIWVHAPTGTTQSEGVPAFLNITLVDDADVIVPLAFTFDIVYAVYSVSIDAETPVDFTRDETKAVAFTLTSESNVRVVVGLNYTLDGTNWTILSHRDEVTLRPFEEDVFTIRMAAEGDVGTVSELEIEIAYGPSAKKKSVTILLRVLDTS
jgi:hypothetical protein